MPAKHKIMIGIAIVLFIHAVFLMATGIGGWEWIVAIAEFVIGAILIAKGLKKSPQLVSS